MVAPLEVRRAIKEAFCGSVKSWSLGIVQVRHSNAGSQGDSLGPQEAHS